MRMQDGTACLAMPGSAAATSGTASARRFALAALALAVAAAALAGWAPLGFSVVTVFLFAGPHNWIEARYFLARMPARWGRLRGFFLPAFAGVFGLTAAFAALPGLGDAWGWGEEGWLTAFAAWNSLLILWVAALVYLRSRQNPRRDWSWTAPAALLLLALAWVAPRGFGLALVYAHPLVALWLLDREIGRSRPGWRRAYRACLACVPLLLGLLWWRLADAPSLPGEDALTVRITRHAGAGILDGVSTHLLVATHTFLEMLHYAVWLAAIPLVGLRGAAWRLHALPLARRSPAWRRLVVAVLAAGAVAVLVLWAGFLADYPTTRDVYFTVAMLHVLAEVPFLLRAL
jgi:hypothetical protein